jgi:pyruvate dehydrogenase E2 component (dihydrolipoamide acetyltransferase)
MALEFKLPDVGEGVAEGEIVQWLVGPNEQVVEDQPLVEVETDKAVVEVPSPVNGHVKEIRAEVGEVVPVGDVIIVLQPEDEGAVGADIAAEPEEVEESGTTGDGAAAASAEAGQNGEAEETATSEAAGGTDRVFASPSARRVARELGVDITTVEGSGPAGRVSEEDVRAAAATESEEAETPAAEPAAESAATATPESTESAESESPGGDGQTAATASEPAGRDRTLAAPATRKLAEEEGVNLDDVPATEERDGQPFVTPEAVREYATSQQAAQAADAEAVSAAGTETDATTAESGAVAAGAEERVPYRGIRRTIGEQMAQSAYTAPHVTHHDRVDVSALVEARAELKPRAEDRGISLSYLPFVMKAVVAALTEFPILNSQLDEDAGEIVKKGYYNVGVATATDAGLMVPVVDDVAGKSLLQLASETNELVAKARDRSISREEMQGGTFTITNFGAIGGEYATPIINYPETAILGLGSLEQRPVVEDGEVVARHVLPLSLSIDHRVVDGAEAAQFTNRLKEYLANPTLLLLE